MRTHIWSKGAGSLKEAIDAGRIYFECSQDIEGSRPTYNQQTANYSRSAVPRKPRAETRETNDQNNYQKKDFKSANKPYIKTQEKKEYSGKKDYTVKKYDNKNIICRNCNKMGHIARECRSKTTTHRVNQIEETEQEEDVEYINCIRSDAKENGILSIRGKVGGHEMLLSLDSDATTSIISVKAAKCARLDILPSEVRVKAANNMVTKVVGITRVVKVEIQGHTCDLELLVLNHDDHDVLLGLDWFGITGAGLFPAEKILKFPSEKIDLNHDERMEREEDVMVSEVVDEPDIAEELCWESESKELEVQPELKLLKKDRVRFNLVMKNMIEIFAYDVRDLKTCNVGKHRIRTLNIPPIYVPPYRKSMSEREVLKEEIKLMLKLGIIEQSKSAWSSPVVLVPKKDGTKRFCVDYRKLNAATITENWPLPRIQDILDRLSGSKWFSALDLTSGYWQIEMDGSSKEKTAFTTPDGHYQFTRMPFGLKNAPAEFSRIMHQVLGNRSYVEIYLDDITIHSKTLEEHFEHISQVAKALKEANLRIKPSKCKWFASKLNILGHVVSGEGVAMETGKIKAISEREPPKTVKQIQQFLGICNYYRRFIKEYAKIAQPLFKLLKTEEKFVWGEEQTTAFERLKMELVSYPILRQPDLSKPFIVYTDASGYALGAVLSQKDDENREYVCAYVSRLLKGAEVHYGITEKECLAVVWAIKQFRIYIYGTKFLVVTDHSALAWLMNITEPAARLARWAIYLQAYEFEIMHRKGVIHTNADTLSRPVNIVTVLNKKQ